MLVPVIMLMTVATALVGVLPTYAQASGPAPWLLTLCGCSKVTSGGGTRNPVLMAMLGESLRGVPVRTSDELGLPSDAKEAYAFAVLGFSDPARAAGHGTGEHGARRPSVLGSVTPGRDGPRLPPPAARQPTRLLLE
ncbi:anhydro-N-acetylmuramic acid kinase [Streptomyces sp. NPDC092370]|uniref:anhydro-N-acetylmuramic acid kinase n=1 Tax=Streptomyces sp. NPDC092370 TaxID=3366016 RepID=UPI0038247411